MFVKKIYANSFMNKLVKQMGKTTAGHISRGETKQLLNSGTHTHTNGKKKKKIQVVMVHFLAL